MRTSVILAICLLTSFSVFGQRAELPAPNAPTSRGAQDSPKRERIVFMTAQRLAVLCREWLRFPVGYMDEASYSASPQQFVRAMGCISYIEGVSDTLLEDLEHSVPYRPKNGQISDARAAIGYFVKYMDRSPGDNDLAAVTVLRRCEIERSRAE